MKAHEQEWMVFPGSATSLGQTAVTDATHRMVALTRVEDGAELAALISAAPDMARALLGVGRFAVEPNGDAGVWHTEACWQTSRAMCTPDCQKARDALRKAGVVE